MGIGMVVVFEIQITIMIITGAVVNLDFVMNTISLFGTEITIQHTSSGHYRIPILPKQIVVNQRETEGPMKLYLTIDNLSLKSTAEKKYIAVKLNIQFGQ